MSHLPHLHYQSLDHTPLPSNLLMLVASPALIYFKSERLNRSLNVFNYFYGFLIILLVIYWAISILLLPFAYLKMLYTILLGKFKNQQCQKITLPKAVTAYYFFQFLVFGMVYLIFKIFVLDTIFFFRKAFRPVPKNHQILFTHCIFKVFKQTIAEFSREQNEEQVCVNEFVDRMRRNFEESGHSQFKGQNRTLDTVCRKLQAFSKPNDNKVDIEYFAQMFYQMKSKRHLKLTELSDRRLQKLYQIEIILGQQYRTQEL